MLELESNSASVIMDACMKKKIIGIKNLSVTGRHIHWAALELFDLCCVQLFTGIF